MRRLLPLLPMLLFVHWAYGASEWCLCDEGTQGYCKEEAQQDNSGPISYYFFCGGSIKAKECAQSIYGKQNVHGKTDCQCLLLTCASQMDDGASSFCTSVCDTDIGSASSCMYYCLVWKHTQWNKWTPCQRSCHAQFTNPFNGPYFAQCMSQCE